MQSVVCHSERSRGISYCLLSFLKNNKRCLDFALGSARHDNQRFACSERFPQFDQHAFYFNGVVLHPAWRVAAPHGMHDCGTDLIDRFLGRLHHLSRARRRKIVGLYWMDRCYLLPDAGFACSSCLCDAAFGDFDTHSGFPSPVGSTSAHRPLDDTNLALCLCHRCACVYDALQMVSSAKSCTRPLVDV